MYLVMQSVIMVLTLQRWSWLHHWCMHVKMSGTLLSAVLVHGQVTIIFVVSCLSACLFVQFFSAVFDPISIKLGRMLYVWV